MRGSKRSSMAATALLLSMLTTCLMISLSNAFQSSPFLIISHPKPKIHRRIHHVPTSPTTTTLYSLQDITDWTPLYLSSIAGASTCIGAAIVFLFPTDQHGFRRISPCILSFALALAGSVMITVSVVAIGPECLANVQTTQELTYRVAFFGVGAGLYYLLSNHVLVPEPEGVMVETLAGDERIIKPSNDQRKIQPDAIKSADDSLDDPVTTPSNPQEQQRAWRLAVLLFLSLLIHNFPEGLAVSASALKSDKLGVSVAAGIAMHNIPEGICISVPCLEARPNQPWLAFGMASVSGLAEPIAAVVPLLLLSGGDEAAEIAGSSMGNALAFTMGIMIMVSLRELLPEAKRQLELERTSSDGGGEGCFESGILTGFVLMYGTETYLSGVL